MPYHQPNTAIPALELPLDADANECDSRIDTFFAEHPDVHHCITLSSEGHIVGEYLQRTHRTGVQIMGYDMVSRNARCLRLGTISFLIAQHAYMQGYNCVDTLFKAIVLKDEVEPVNFMPIELLSKENIDFYRRKQL